MQQSEKRFIWAHRPLWWWALMGLAVGSVFLLFVLAQFAFLGDRIFEKSGSNLLSVTITYLAGGTLGGSVVGLLFPLARYKLGAFLIGSLGLAPLFVCQSIVRAGGLSVSSFDLVQSLLLAALIGGNSAVAFAFAKDEIDRKSEREEPIE